MLNFIYYPVSALLWIWYKAFGSLLGPGDGFVWALAVVFLSFTRSAMLVKPSISRDRSDRKKRELMQVLEPEIQELEKTYGDDHQKLATKRQELHARHGFNPLAGYWSSLIALILGLSGFFGLLQVLRSFNRSFLSAEQNRLTGNYVFSAADVHSFLDAHLFGVPLSASVTEPAGLLARYGDISRGQIATLAILLTILSSVFSHLYGRRSLRRQTPAQAAQGVVMKKLIMYLSPLVRVAIGLFLPLGILLYLLSNNLWSLVQQPRVYRRIDGEDAENLVTQPPPQRTSHPPKPPADGRPGSDKMRGQMGGREGNAHVILILVLLIVPLGILIAVFVGYNNRERVAACLRGAGASNRSSNDDDSCTGDDYSGASDHRSGTGNAI